MLSTFLYQCSQLSGWVRNSSVKDFSGKHPESHDSTPWAGGDTGYGWLPWCQIERPLLSAHTTQRSSFNITFSSHPPLESLRVPLSWSYLHFSGFLNFSPESILLVPAASSMCFFNGGVTWGVDLMGSTLPTVAFSNLINSNWLSSHGYVGIPHSSLNSNSRTKFSVTIMEWMVPPPTSYVEVLTSVWLSLRWGL